MEKKILEKTLDLQTNNHAESPREFSLLKTVLFASLAAAIYVGEPVFPGRKDPIAATLEPRSFAVNEMEIAPSQRVEQPKEKVGTIVNSRKISAKFQSMALPCLVDLKAEIINSLENPFPNCHRIFLENPSCNEIFYKYLYRSYLLAYATQNSKPQIATIITSKALEHTRCRGSKFQRIFTRIFNIQKRSSKD